MLLLALGAAALLAAAPGAGAQTRRPPRDPGDFALIAERGEDGAELVGRRAPSFTFTRWLRGPERSLEDLRGKVVLVRWWTEGCAYCETTLPGLEALRKRYGSRGLVVIGAFHPKPPREVPDREILAKADRLGFAGPIAVDERWETLERWWLEGHERAFTSASFLIGRDGVIRWVHPGGEYHPSTDAAHARCDLEYKGLVAAIERALQSS